MSSEENQTSDRVKRIIERLVAVDDTSRLTSEEKTEYLLAVCESLGLNPLTRPVQFIRFQGKELAYLTRGATDQLAKKHGISRKILAGPEIRDFGGTKLLYCEAQATDPSGRTDTSIATMPARVDENSPMKCESKAKRRVLISILGLGFLSEEESEDLAASESRSAAVEAPPKKAKPQMPSFGPVSSDPDEADYIASLAHEALDNAGQEVSGLVSIYHKYNGLPTVKAESLYFVLKDCAKTIRKATEFHSAVSALVSKKPPAAPSAAASDDSVAKKQDQTAAATAVHADASSRDDSVFADLSFAVLSKIDAENNDVVYRVLSQIGEAVSPAELAAILLEGNLSGLHENIRRSVFSLACKRICALNQEAGVEVSEAAAETVLRKEIASAKSKTKKAEKPDAVTSSPTSSAPSPATETSSDIAVGEPSSNQETSSGEAVQTAQDDSKAEPVPFESLILNNSDEGSAAWIAHLKGKSDKDGGGVAGSFAKRAAAFEKAGVADVRKKQTITVAAGIRGRGEIEAFTFIRDILQTNKKSKR